MNRRDWIAALLVAGLGASWGPGHARTSAEEPLATRSIAVLDFELVDEQNNPLTKAAQVRRLRNATLQLREALAEARLYVVVDPAPSQALQDRMRAHQAFLYRCVDCAVQVGRLLEVDLVMTPWVQKVSELILNLNVQIHDVKADRILFSKSVDLRGNDDRSWTRAVRYLVRDMAEKRARNPAYAQ